MDNLSLHIEYLLLRNECVVIPGFGAFLNVWHPARYDEATGLYHPMEREVRFNSALTHDDGLLASSFSRKYQVNFQEGRELLRHEISSLRDALAEEGEATIGRIGILRSNEEGGISFSPMQSAAGMMRELGYVAVRKEHSKPAAAMEVNRPVSAAKGSDMLQESSDAKDQREENGSGRRFDTRRNYYIPVNKIFARTAACLIFLLVVALSVIVPASNNRKEDRASVVPVEKIVDSAAQVARVAKKSVTSEAAAEKTPAKIESPADRYQIIVAAFHTRKEAENFIALYKESGYDLQIDETKTMCRVSALRGDDRNALTATLNEKRFRENFPQAWVWEKPADR